MSDIIDTANDQAQLILDKQIALAKGVKLDIFPNESGLCWDCDAPITDKRRWCSKECAEAAEKNGW
jgi:predicted amidophosphoribosyltransferase